MATTTVYNIKMLKLLSLLVLIELVISQETFPVYPKKSSNSSVKILNELHLDNGFKPVFNDDARFVTITTVSSVGKRKKKVKKKYSQPDHFYGDQNQQGQQFYQGQGQGQNQQGVNFGQGQGGLQQQGQPSQVVGHQQHQNEGQYGQNYNPQQVNQLQQPVENSYPGHNVNYYGPSQSAPNDTRYNTNGQFPGLPHNPNNNPNQGQSINPLKKLAGLFTRNRNNRPHVQQQQYFGHNPNQFGQHLPNGFQQQHFNRPGQGQGPPQQVQGSPVQGPPQGPGQLQGQQSHYTGPSIPSQPGLSSPNLIGSASASIPLYSNHPNQFGQGQFFNQGQGQGQQFGPQAQPNLRPFHRPQQVNQQGPYQTFGPQMGQQGQFAPGHPQQNQGQFPIQQGHPIQSAQGQQFIEQSPGHPLGPNQPSMLSKLRQSYVSTFHNLFRPNKNRPLNQIPNQNGQTIFHNYPVNNLTDVKNPNPNGNRRRIKLKRKDVNNLVGRPRNSEDLEPILDEAVGQQGQVQGHQGQDELEELQTRRKRETQVNTSGYRMPGLFYDKTKPFYLDKDSSGQVSFQDSSTDNNSTQKPSVVIASSYSKFNSNGNTTYKRPSLSNLNSKLKNKRPTFYKFNKSTMSPPRLPSFYSTSATTPSTVSTTDKTELETSTEKLFPNVIMSVSSEIVTSVSSSSSSSSKEVRTNPNKGVNKKPVFNKKFTSGEINNNKISSIAPTTTTTTSTTTTTEPTTVTVTSTEPITTTTEPTTTTTTIKTETKPTFDPYLPKELQSISTQPSTTTTTTTEISTTSASTTIRPTAASTIITTIMPIEINKQTITTVNEITQSDDNMKNSFDVYETNPIVNEPMTEEGLLKIVELPKSTVPVLTVTTPTVPSIDPQISSEEEEDYYYDVNANPNIQNNQFYPNAIPNHFNNYNNYPNNYQQFGGQGIGPFFGQPGAQGNFQNVPYQNQNLNPINQGFNVNGQPNYNNGMNQVGQNQFNPIVNPIIPNVQQEMNPNFIQKIVKENNNPSQEVVNNVQPIPSQDPINSLLDNIGTVSTSEPDNIALESILNQPNVNTIQNAPITSAAPITTQPTAPSTTTTQKQMVQIKTNSKEQGLNIGLMPPPMNHFNQGPPQGPPPPPLTRGPLFNYYGKPPPPPPNRYQNQNRFNPPPSYYPFRPPPPVKEIIRSTTSLPNIVSYTSKDTSNEDVLINGNVSGFDLEVNQFEQISTLASSTLRTTLPTTTSTTTIPTTTTTTVPSTTTTLRTTTTSKPTSPSTTTLPTTTTTSTTPIPSTTTPTTTTTTTSQPPLISQPNPDYIYEYIDEEVPAVPVPSSPPSSSPPQNTPTEIQFTNQLLNHNININHYFNPNQISDDFVSTTTTTVPTTTTTLSTTTEPPLPSSTTTITTTTTTTAVPSTSPPSPEYEYEYEEVVEEIPNTNTNTQVNLQVPDQISNIIKSTMENQTETAVKDPQNPMQIMMPPPIQQVNLNQGLNQGPNQNPGQQGQNQQQNQYYNYNLNPNVYRPKPPTKPSNPLNFLQNLFNPSKRPQSQPPPPPYNNNPHGQHTPLNTNHLQQSSVNYPQRLPPPNYNNNNYNPHQRKSSPNLLPPVVTGEIDEEKLFGARNGTLDESSEEVIYVTQDELNKMKLNGELDKDFEVEVEASPSSTKDTIHSQIKTVPSSIIPAKFSNENIDKLASDEEYYDDDEEIPNNSTTLDTKQSNLTQNYIPNLTQNVIQNLPQIVPQNIQQNVQTIPKNVPAAQSSAAPQSSSNLNTMEYNFQPILKTPTAPPQLVHYSISPQNKNYYRTDYDESIELITASPTSPKPLSDFRTVVVKSSFNTRNNQQWTGL